MREEGKHKSRGSQKWKWARVVQHRRKCIDLRAGVKAKAKSNIGNSHRDRHRAGTRTKAEANSGDSKTVVRTKAENDSGNSKTNGNSHQDGLKHHKKISHTFRATPRSTMKKSPAERLYGRRFNTRLLGGGNTKARDQRRLPPGRPQGRRQDQGRDGQLRLQDQDQPRRLSPGRAQGGRQDQGRDRQRRLRGREQPW